MKESDLSLFKEFIKSINLEPLNTRTFKVAENEYLVRVGSIEHRVEAKEFKGA